MKMTALEKGERLDDLQNGFQIIQNPKKFCFGLDAVLLSAFVRVKVKEKVIDLGTGTGVIPLLLRGRTQGRQYAGLEIQDYLADMAVRSVHHNGLESEIEIRQGDIREASAIYGRASFDVVTCNPPYITAGHGIENPDISKAVARHEIQCTFSDIARESARLLRNRGRLYLVHRPYRLAEIMRILQEQQLEPKRMQLVYPYVDREPTLILLEAVLGGRTRLQIEKPLILYESPGVYTDDLQKIYDRNQD